MEFIKHWHTTTFAMRSRANGYEKGCLRTEAVFGAAKIATNAWAGLQKGWTETVDFLRDSWTTFTTFLAKNWNKVAGFIKGAWQKLKSTVTGKDTTTVQKQIQSETARMNAELDDKRDLISNDESVLLGCRRIFAFEIAVHSKNPG